MCVIQTQNARNKNLLSVITKMNNTCNNLRWETVLNDNDSVIIFPTTSIGRKIYTLHHKRIFEVQRSSVSQFKSGP